MSEYTKFIDSVVGNIARKIEDEFNESDHPRDKGGKFASKGGEGGGDNSESDTEEVNNSSEIIQRKLRRNMSTHVEDLVDYAKEDGYEAELESEEYMIVRKDGKEYRAHIDKAGDTYYVNRVEEL